jgi:8-oxo-dGTP pyrophosphatase MutT (NUDIX family)/phosphohistidine phosphatase SixA
MIEAAGVVLIRPGTEPTVLVIHRAHRNDWSLPKGKLEPGENAAVAAVRETLEETGYSVKVQLPLTPVSYQVGDLNKIVYYWSATELNFDETAVPNSEVDQLRWVTLKEASELLSYKHDLAVVVEALAITQPGIKTALVVRHAISVNRENFDGEDLQRPLADAGSLQTNQIAEVLAAYGVTKLISSPAIRCQQTLQQYAHRQQLQLQLDPILLEENSAFDEIKWRELVSQPQLTAFCTHRPVIDVISQFEPDAQALLTELLPAAIVVLSWDQAGELISTERHQI